MKKSLLSPRAEAVCTRLFLLLFLALSVLLFCSSFTSSWVHHAWNEEAVFLEKDSWAANLALLLLGLAFLAGSLRLLRHRIAQLPMNRRWQLRFWGPVSALYGYGFPIQSPRRIKI